MQVKLTTEQQKALLYVGRARSTDKKYPAMGAARLNGMAEAADGFRYHAVKIEFNEVGLWHYGKPADTMELRPEEGALPDLARIVPTGIPQSEACINVHLLRDAIAGLSGDVIIRLYGPTHPMEILGRVNVPRIRNDEGPEAYALIMPTVMNNRMWPWKPYR